MIVNYAEINFPTTKPHHCNECGDPVSEGSILINGFCLDCIYLQMIDMELEEENDQGEPSTDKTIFQTTD